MIASFLLSFLFALHLPAILANPIPHRSINTDPTDRYIVVLKPSIDLASHLTLVHDLHDKTKRKAKAAVYGGVTHTYNISTFQAYAGHFSTNVAEQLRHHDDVLHFEPDQIWNPASLVTQSRAPDALNMISHRSGAKGNQYIYDSSAGAGTYGYIVDSGINVKHIDFGGRALPGHSVIPMVPNDDVSGHGTHVAGIVGSTTWGAAKQSTLISVKVFHESGAPVSVILAGYDWAVGDIKAQRRQDRAAILAATWGAPSKAFDAAVKAAAANGILTVTSAGNGNAPAGNLAAGARGGALVVGATGPDRVRAHFSNYGAAVSLWAPGVKIASTWIGSTRATNFRSGSSQAAAHVMGVALYLKGMKRTNSKKELAGLASRGVVGDTKGASNLFLYNGSGK